mmetsp:Transcript_11147/g.29372  ORF Transcript_11147/g.29372 Transcript_11147/m.29372 type:complete len:90 (-) Transcript_11147:10-279(-)
MERVENRVIKWVIGTVGTSVALVLGFIRLSMGDKKTPEPPQKPPAEQPPATNSGGRRFMEDEGDRQDELSSMGSKHIPPHEVKKLIGLG